MNGNRKLIYSILLALVFLAIVFGLAVSFPRRTAGLKVVFLDVGQGDAILISQGSDQLLVDGGRDGKLLLEKLGRYMPFWDRTVETVVVTHPDQDHLGGLIAVAKAYQIETILETSVQSGSQTDKYWEQLLADKNITKIEAQKGVSLQLSSGGNMTVLYPLASVVEQNVKDTNAFSVVARLQYGTNSFLFTGDFPTEQDALLLESGQDLKAEFLKVSHHGSRYATSAEFLDAVQPRDAIISVGKNNTYGHPNEETLQRLKERKVDILRTDEKGDIVFNCQSLSSNCEIARK